MENNSTIKVIHIVESLHRGAVENWLIRMFSFAKEKGVCLDWTFYCIEKFQGDKESIVAEIGGKLIKSEFNWSRPFKLMKSLRRHLVNEKYDVIHCHHDFMSSLYLLSSFGLKLKKIVHIHNMDEHIPTSSKIKAGVLRFLFRRISWCMADKIVGISNHTLDKFILNRKRNEQRDTLHYYGVDSSKFINTSFNKLKFSKKYNIPEESKVLLFLGRLAPAKNPLFALKVFYEMQKEREDLFALFVGDGGLKYELISLARELKIENKFKFLGWSDEVEVIMKNSDLFILPHVEYPMEGLGLVILEAQLSGLPLLISNGVSLDPILPSANFEQLSLSVGMFDWAKSGLSLLDIAKNEEHCIELEFNNSVFNLDYALDNLLNLYYDS